MSTEQEQEIKDYIQKYAEKHHITVDEAKEHLMCKLASFYYGKEQNQSIKVIYFERGD